MTTDSRADQRGAISGLLNLAHDLGRITGASTLGAGFALAAATTDIAPAPAVVVATGMRVTFGVATRWSVGRAGQRGAQPCARRYSFKFFNSIKPFSMRTTDCTIGHGGQENRTRSRM